MPEMNEYLPTAPSFFLFLCAFLMILFPVLREIVWRFLVMATAAGILIYVVIKVTPHAL